MSDRKFQLKPFPTAKALPYLEIVTTVSRRDKLTVNYLLQGNLSQIILPPIKERVSRQDELWQTTCFEFFLAVFHSRQYWEFNLAPTGDWNSYRFTDYRRRMTPSIAITALPFEVTANNDSTYQITAQLDLKNIIAGNTPLEIAIATVIEDTDGNLSYWAITHPGRQADFHRRDSFITI